MTTTTAIFAGTITVIDPDTQAPVELEIWKDGQSGIMLGVDASYLDQVSRSIANPYNKGRLRAPPDNDAPITFYPAPATEASSAPLKNTANR